jgi:hypothetical protein
MLHLGSAVAVIDRPLMKIPERTSDEVEDVRAAGGAVFSL